jgi:hypothetical protein
VKKQKRYKTTPEQRIKAGQPSVLFYDKAKGDETAVTHAQLKRNELQERDNVLLGRQQQQPVPIDGTELPAQGWSLTRPTDPELVVCGVRCVKMSDGSTLKLYRVAVRPEAVKARKRKAKKVLQRIQREDAKAARHRVKLMLIMLGKA